MRNYALTWSIKVHSYMESTWPIKAGLCSHSCDNSAWARVIGTLHHSWISIHTCSLKPWQATELGLTHWSLWSGATFAAWCSIFSCLIITTSCFHASVIEMCYHLFALSSTTKCVLVLCEMSNWVPLTCSPVRPSTGWKWWEAMLVLTQQWQTLRDN